MTSSKKLIPLLLLCIWITLMFFLSSQNGEQTASTSSGIADWIAMLFYKAPTQPQVNHIHMLLRKSAHIILFFGVGAISFYTFLILCKKRPILTMLASLILTVLVAFFDEWYKIYIPGRHCDMGEALLNAISGLIAIGFYILLHRFRRRKE